MLRWLTAGESHGPALVAVLEGLPAGVRVTSRDVGAALARRRLGYGRGARMSFEQDEVEFLGGLRHGLTLGSPLAIRIGNTEWPKWETVMSPDPVDESAYAAADDVNAEKEIARNRPLTRPRPGHADLVGMQKYGFEDARPVLERASARETAAQVALGAVASVPRPGVRHPAGVAHRGDRDGERGRGNRAAAPRGRGPARRRPGTRLRRLRVRRHGGRGRRGQEGRRHLGGVVEVVAYGVPPGLGSHVHWDRRLDAQLAAAMMGIQAIKGVEVGDGFTTARRRGSQAHDEMERDAPGRSAEPAAPEVPRGMSTGEVLG